MKKGTILINPWVSNNHPFRKSVYMGIKGRYFETWYVNENKLEKVQFYKCDLKNFVVDGHSEAYVDFIKQLEIDLVAK